MRASKWLRLASGALAPFWIGHTAAIVLAPSRGAEEQAVYATMKQYSFDALGFRRSHWINAIWFMIPPAVCSALAGLLVLGATKHRD